VKPEETRPRARATSCFGSATSTPAPETSMRAANTSMKWSGNNPVRLDLLASKAETELTKVIADSLRPHSSTKEMDTSSAEVLTIVAKTVMYSADCNASEVSGSALKELLASC